MTEIYMPEFPACASVRISPNQRTKVTTAASGKILSRVHGGQSYRMNLKYNPMLRSEAAPLFAFLQAQEGRNGIFRVKVPQLNGTGGTKVGSFVNFVGSTKLHMVTAEDPLAFSPLPEEGAVLDTQLPYMRCSLARDVQEISLDNRGLITFSVSLVERV